MNFDDIKTKIVPILEASGVGYAAVFGSFARGEAGPKSDVDLLVKFKQPVGLFEFAGVADKLEAAVGRKVDLVTEGGISPYIKDQVLRDLKVIYG